MHMTTSLLNKRITSDCSLINPHSQTFVAVGVYEVESDSVACVKREIETVLRGYIAMDGEAILWENIFAMPAGLQYLTELYGRRENIYGGI